MSVSPIAQQSIVPGATNATSSTTAFAPLAPAERVLTGAGQADVVSGQLGVNFKNGKPAAMLFFDTSGRKLTQTPFEPTMILETMERLKLPMGDLATLADEMDAAAVAYKPYGLFAGTGSDHGIDLRDLAKGGLGTAYDWRNDTAIAQKGAMAAQRQADVQALAQRLNIQANPEVTTGGGLQVATLAPQVDGEGITRSYVVTNGGWAMWYRTQPEARLAANAAWAALIDLTQNVNRS